MCINIHLQHELVLRFTPYITFRLSFSDAESKFSKNKQKNLVTEISVYKCFSQVHILQFQTLATRQQANPANQYIDNVEHGDIHRLSRHLPSPSSSSSPPSSSSSSTSLSCSPSSSYKKLINKDHSPSAVMNEKEKKMQSWKMSYNLAIGSGILSILCLFGLFLLLQLQNSNSEIKQPV